MDGVYYLVNFDLNSDCFFVVVVFKNFKEIFIDNFEVYGEVNNIIFFVFEGEMIVLVGSVDFVLIFCNVYNMVLGGYVEKVLMDMFVVLKFGGVLGVVDYRFFKFIE